VLTTLSDLGQAAEALSGPALLIVGEAMALANPLIPAKAGTQAASATNSTSEWAPTCVGVSGL